jgi:hypothetical protein
MQCSATNLVSSELLHATPSIVQLSMEAEAYTHKMFFSLSMILLNASRITYYPACFKELINRGSGSCA